MITGHADQLKALVEIIRPVRTPIQALSWEDDA